MATTAEASAIRPIAGGGVARQLPFVDVGTADSAGVWPRTNRLLPWLVALFLVMVLLVPFDSIVAPFSLGVDSKLDRVMLVLVGGMWLVLAAGAGRYGPRFRKSPLNAAILVVVVCALGSMAANVTTLIHLDLLTLSVKQLALLLSYFAFFYIAVTSIRREEVHNFLKFMVILSCLTAVGTIWEYRTHSNLFYSLAASIFKGFTVGTPPLGNSYGRPAVVGPTQTSLADATILAIALSFALVFLLHAKERRNKILWFIATALLLAGSLSTQRKSSVLIPLVAVVVLTVYSPRRMLRFAPAFLILLAMVYAISPHAISGLRYQFLNASNSTSTLHRTSAFGGIKPYILANPILGRGYGSYDPRRYGILDDQYLGLIIQTGFVGLVGFVGLLITGAVLAHKALRSKNPARVLPGLALLGAIGGFAVACATFDVLSFPQVPYLLMFVLALAVVGAERSRHPWMDGASAHVPNAVRAWWSGRVGPGGTHRAAGAIWHEGRQFRSIVVVWNADQDGSETPIESLGNSRNGDPQAPAELPRKN